MPTDFTNVATNADMVAIATAIRNLTRTASPMTIPQMAQRLSAVRVVEWGTKTVNFSTGSSVDLVNFANTDKHFFLVFPKTNADVTKLSQVDPATNLTVTSTKASLNFSRNRNLLVDLVIVDLFLATDATNSAGNLISELGASFLVKSYDTTKAYRVGELFKHNDAIGLTITDHEAESFDTTHNKLYMDKTYVDGLNTAQTGALTAEITRATNAETTLQNNINAEATLRQNTDTALYDAIADEAELRESEDEALQDNIDAEETARESADTIEATARSNADTTLQANITNEATVRGDADVNLQNQIDALVSKSDVVDIVATKAELLLYDTSKLHNKDVIKVLKDESLEDPKKNATAYYRWLTADSQFHLIGDEGPYQTLAGATASHNTLQGNIDAEATRAQGAESTLTTNLATEVARSTAKDTVLETAIATEKTRAETEEAKMIQLLGNEAGSGQPYHFPYHFVPSWDNSTKKIGIRLFTVTLDNNKTLTQYTGEIDLSASFNEKVDKEAGKSLVSDTDIAQITTNKNNIASLQTGLNAEVTRATNAEAGKVDKVAGKGLSTNDYDNTEKAKVDGAVQSSTSTTGTEFYTRTAGVNGVKTSTFAGQIQKKEEADASPVAVEAVKFEVSTDSTTGKKVLDITFGSRI